MRKGRAGSEAIDHPSAAIFLRHQFFLFYQVEIRCRHSLQAKLPPN